MKKVSYRACRAAELIQRQLAVVFQREIADPRLQFLTVMTVNVSVDLSYADVGIAHLDNSIDVKKLLIALNKASPKLRYCLGKRLNWRSVPTLRFFYNDNLQRINDLCSQIDQALLD